MASGLPVPPRETWNSIDEALYGPGPGKLFTVENENADELRLNAIRFSFNHHYNHNSFYQGFCKQRRVSPEDVKTFDDLDKIPLLPDTFFKGYPEPQRFIEWLRAITSDDVEYPEAKGSSYDELINALHEHGVTVTFSTGTSGRFTFIPRDRITSSRAAFAGLSIAQLLGQKPQPEDYYVFFGPNPWKTRWILANHAKYNVRPYKKEKTSFMMDFEVTAETLRTLMSPAQGHKGRKIRERMMTTRDEADRKVIQLFQRADDEKAGGSIGGAAFWVYETLSKIEHLGKRFSLGDKWVVGVGGGWKGLEDITHKAFREKVEDVLGIPDENCRDIYGLSESVSPFAECEGHYFHIMNTLIHPFVLDDELNPVGFEEHGRFAFLDVMRHNLPGYIITGDKVKLLESCPTCNRHGPVIEPPITRMPGVEDRGCVMVMHRFMAEETQKA